MGFYGISMDWDLDLDRNGILNGILIGFNGYEWDLMGY